MGKRKPNELRQMAGAVAAMHDCVMQIVNLYHNDVPGQNLNRADLIADQARRAERISRILWDYPPDFPAVSEFTKPKDTDHDR